ncbi:MAG: putative toxin-antitoxin system toxin component, PIN family [Eubacterium sp.]|jgi:putative PIN family toxin of toxin-antitoxin system|nr:putative toxin-antitoxin system toxin component, PIN family [Eubacterium sp.]
MKIMIDTNIFISAALFPNGKASAALRKALSPPYQPLTCDYVIDELHRKFREKFPDKMTELEAFLYSALPVIHVIPTPEEAMEAENKIRVPKDRPILRTALSSNADLLLTGDKDFLESSVTDPRIISVTKFLNQ